MIRDSGALDRTIDTLAARLLDARTPDGHWEGRLASSALSTATAVVALTLHQHASAHDHTTIIESGRAWLTATQNEDGGWGDTVLSANNLSTTVLCWAALRSGPALDRADRWLRARTGDLTPAALREAILARYGRDRTFSVPILTVLALAGRLGSDADGWRLVPQLPFELAACPHRCFRWLRLPVVSYALPALVAIGQVRHHHAPTRNPALASIRSALRTRTLEIARGMQPESGGYLEAVPLTAFVVMSLVSAGATRHAIVERGTAFLARAARPDGSWPIDTNLATWVTTHAVAALALDRRLTDDDRRRILQWLLDQQAAREHPFTHAQPGGWAWTNLAGGVPDADDTAGALLALRDLGGAAEVQAASAGLRWLLDLQNRDGGIPTFCRGWGALPFDRSAPDLTAHALEAWNGWFDAVVLDLQRRMAGAAARAVAYLARRQRPDGSWAPLWFGNQHVAGELNLTYGTARVVRALAVPLARRSPAADRSRTRGLSWLMRAQNEDGGWGGGRGSPSSLEETGLALDALARSSDASTDVVNALLRGTRWVVDVTSEGQHTPPAPIGLYFARLWYYEELYPLAWSLTGMSQARARLALTP